MIEPAQSASAPLVSAPVQDARPVCRFCGTPLRSTFVDLGLSPLSERYRAADELDRMEPFYPLHVRVCERCFLVQIQQDVPSEEIFTEYAYFSFYSDPRRRMARVELTPGR